MTPVTTGSSSQGTGSSNSSDDDSDDDDDGSVRAEPLFALKELRNVRVSAEGAQQPLLTR
jgi:hypothetical protein